jgi:hypothetical protein
MGAAFKETKLPADAPAAKKPWPGSTTASR